MNRKQGKKRKTTLQTQPLSKEIEPQNSKNSITSLSQRQIAIAVFLTLLSIVPIWLIPIAPLSDWVTHLVLSKEAYWLLTGHSNNYYAVDFSFFGYQTVYLLLILFQYFVDWQTAGKLLLSLLMVLAPLCWWLFFRLLDRTKESLFFLGSLMNYTWFFYVGMVPYLFAMPISLVFIALGIRVLQGSRRLLPVFVVLGILTFITHGYVAFIAYGILAMVFVYELLFGEKRSLLLPASLFLLFLFSEVALFAFSQTKTIDTSYYDNVKYCSKAGAQSDVYSSFAIFDYISTVIDKVTFSRIFASFFPFSHIYPPLWLAFNVSPPYLLSALLSSQTVILSVLTVAILALVFIKVRFFSSWMFSRDYRRSFFKDFQFNRFFYLAVSLFLLYFILPTCSVISLSICPINTRLIPFAFAFLAISIRHRTLEKNLWLLLAVLLFSNTIYQGFVFSNDASSESSLFKKIKQASDALPENVTVFVVPGIWTSSSDFYSIPFGSHYHALLLAFKPSLYVSSMFMAQDNLIIRSDFQFYDEMANFGPFYPTSCYDSPPCAYQWIIEDDLKPRRNDNCTA